MKNVNWMNVVLVVTLTAAVVILQLKGLPVPGTLLGILTTVGAFMLDTHKADGT